MAMWPGLVNKRRLKVWGGKETGTSAFQAEGRRLDPGLPLHSPFPILIQLIMLFNARRKR